MKKLTMLTAALAISASFASPAAFAQQKFVTIGTGGVTGVYYAAGGAICRLMNKDKAKHGMRCSVESTGGSVYNVNTIKAGELDFGVAQSDVAYNAMKGENQFKGAPFADLRSVFSIHPEPLVVLARKDANIVSLADFKGKRFNIGNPGSGQRATMEVLLAEMKMKLSDFSLVSEMKADEHGPALCDNKIDGFAYVVGNPSANIQDPTTTCGAQLVNIIGPAVDKLVKTYPYYAAVTIPGGMYAANPNPTNTYGVVAAFVSSSKVPNEVVYTMVKSVFENLDDFKKLHPAFAHLDPKEMIKNGLSAPLHDGAVKYYKEKGWM
ncbi:C4-dicarboxylate ABC transporter substrate-binding protein [Candidatus Propionivibrio aalborgensis]|jgi:TRAP transporter TAXI family solute receptor|uniref:C4-dicarboxylate ABC transporter substrate-binding protein n=3 Tax=Candidatus Propionivibrio aalborgensis TaxID=1860101 RepID=A0A1A8XT15_9RHOO|nr:TAXI family TRAP transporter solute-binding subunit [Candidatus Propionivibrio aalborgensis]MBK7326674.1 TAXI family TRAP transporter solute-binding subunit [Propionivibrio sp.]MBK7565439.1 TAXI family TRAP transporter solute-binding subunit [Propionivibrio sp.]MBK9027660.1 TAXI family TRAP transporter solute-binding subunit [Propionivibrio sp.]SBT07876.1 C4-dicarboxylate ABC transporter substrate-binding protein [Candidatus Propionivibrio aalborgensis]HRC59717.1 TAXI family TRAP transporte